MRTITLNFVDYGANRLEIRRNRAFVPRRTEQSVIAAIERCKDVDEVEDIAVSNDLCDYCDFGALNIKTTAVLVKAVTRLLYRFPRLRSKINYIGSKIGYLDMLRRLKKLDREVTARLGIENIVTDYSLRELADLCTETIEGTEYNGGQTNLLAQAFDMCGIVDAVIMDEEDFSGFGYMRFCRQLTASIRMGYHPRNCDDPAYIVYHELGHTLDTLCGICTSREFAEYYGGLTKSEIESGVSVYAATNEREFFAEAFAEYICSPAPRETALFMGNLLNKKYKLLGG